MDWGTRFSQECRPIFELTFEIAHVDRKPYKSQTTSTHLAYMTLLSVSTAMTENYKAEKCACHVVHFEAAVWRSIACQSLFGLILCEIKPTLQWERTSVQSECDRYRTQQEGGRERRVQLTLTARYITAGLVVDRNRCRYTVSPTMKTNKSFMPRQCLYCNGIAWHCS